MCDPVTLGVTTAVSGIASTVGSAQSAAAQAREQNNANVRRLNQRNRQYELDTLQGIAEYNTAKLDVERQQEEAARELSEFVADEQLARDDRINEYLLADQTLVTKLLGERAANEGGRARSYGGNLAREIGRSRALLVSNLDRSAIASKRAIDKTRRSAQAQRQSLYAGVANPFRPGPAPSQELVEVKGPSPLGTIAGVAGSVVQGAATYNQFAPEGQKIGDPK